MNIILFSEIPDAFSLPYNDERAQHIRKVLRLKPGDTFSAGVINGEKVVCELTGFDDQAKLLSITCIARFDVVSPLLSPVTLLVGQVRPICMKRILREAASLGVSRILVVGADTAERSYREAGIWRSGEYVRHVIDGGQQAAATGIPEVHLFRSVDEVLQALASQTDAGLRRAGTRIVLDNIIPSIPLQTVAVDPQQEILLAIGPERGWSDRERELFLTHGFHAAGMGVRVLRTETACTAAVAIILSRIGLM